jgi:hypothetical protein
LLQDPNLPQKIADQINQKLSTIQQQQQQQQQQQPKYVLQSISE